MTNNYSSRNLARYRTQNEKNIPWRVDLSFKKLIIPLCLLYCYSKGYTQDMAWCDLKRLKQNHVGLKWKMMNNNEAQHIMIWNTHVWFLKRPWFLKRTLLVWMFITDVFSRPSLWQSRNTHFKNRGVVEKFWLDVAVAVDSSSISTSTNDGSLEVFFRHTLHSPMISYYLLKHWLHNLKQL